MNLENYIRDKACELEIDVIGFTDKIDYSELIDVLDDRREKNFETEFEEKDLFKRTNPRLLLECVKSIIVVGVSYFKNIDCNLKQKERERVVGFITKSATGIDYHRVVMEKMEKLVEEIEKKTTLNYKLGVDTTPLIDRALASEAGVGWYGRNSLIINDKFGSFISLGFILTDLELESDKKEKQKCGNCSLCITNCPVGAIKDGYELNSKICISRLTQTKEDIAYPLRDKMENKVYGCDTCQMVCPKNKHLIESRVVKDDSSLNCLNIEEILKMSNREFKAKYSAAAFSWRGKNVIKRNCIIALGNSKDERNISLLKEQLTDQSPMIRKYSAWAILKLDKEVGEVILDEHERHEKDKDVLDEINKLKIYFK